MTEYYDNIKVGDEVYVDCFTSMGASSAGYTKVTKIETKYDVDTGEPYRVIKAGGRKFDGRDGNMTKSSGMFYIAEDT
jgi:hypothetical protein